MAQVQVHYRDGEAVTGRATDDLDAGIFVKITGAWGDRRVPQIAAAAAGDIPFGFIRRDTAEGEYVAVDRQGFVVDLASTGTIKAGDAVSVGANGKAVKATAAGEGTTGSYVAGYAVADSAAGYTSIAVQ